MKSLILYALVLFAFGCRCPDNPKPESVHNVELYSKSEKRWLKVGKLSNIDYIKYYHDDSENPLALEIIFLSKKEVKLFNSLLTKRIKLVLRDEVLYQGVIMQNFSGNKVYCEGGISFPSEKTKTALIELTSNGVFYEKKNANQYKISTKENLLKDVSSMFEKEEAKEEAKEEERGHPERGQRGVSPDQ